jgi:sugar phosphate isomerase/epimerase
MASRALAASANHAEDYERVYDGGIMGDGVIAIKRLREAVTQAGYNGPIEVEIFNEELWQLPGGELLRLIKDRFLQYV